MSMDEVFESMKIFEKELDSFNNRLKESFEDLSRNHDRVAPLWQDSMRKEYDARWNSLEEHMKEYVAVDGSTYIEILNQKLAAIRGYLYGN